MSAHISNNTFYIRLDYKAVYVGYQRRNKKPLEQPYTPSGIEYYQELYNYFKNQYQFNIGRWTIESIFTHSNSLISQDSLSVDIKGRNLITGEPDILTISMNEINNVIEPLIIQVATQVSLNWENFIPVELHADLKSRGFKILNGDFPYPDDFIPILREKLSVHLIN